MRAIAGVAKNTGLAARHHFDRLVAFQEPADQIDIVGQHVEHRRGMWIALEDGEGLGPRIIDARQSAAHLAEPTVNHLLLGAQKAFFEAAAVTHPQGAAGRFESLKDRLGVVERQGQRLFHQDRFAEFERPAHRRGMFAFGRRDEHRIDVRMRDHGVVVGGMEIGAGELGQLFGLRRVPVGHGQKTHRRVPGRQPRP